ncbi:hypothetical protein AAFF_G00288940 [Aldrovandia affinis]|uniref:Uncharacterized protein n=1 Tax=Aldrovandia affinis TaxID=143900 RepID=A0AAD7WSB8_9TELE|nr:hypothetical protein AAFF_G00288940 [Aldrovandia affinis]
MSLREAGAVSSSGRAEPMSCPSGGPRPWSRAFSGPAGALTSSSYSCAPQDVAPVAREGGGGLRCGSGASRACTQSHLEPSAEHRRATAAEKRADSAGRQTDGRTDNAVARLSLTHTHAEGKTGEPPSRVSG